jgi:DNA polymerase I
VALWPLGRPWRRYPGAEEAVERNTGILTEVDTYDWITFLPMSDGTGAYNRYFGRLNTGKMKIRGVMARKGDTPEYVNKMQQEVFEVLHDIVDCLWVIGEPILAFKEAVERRPAS